MMPLVCSAPNRHPVKFYFCRLRAICQGTNQFQSQSRNIYNSHDKNADVLSFLPPPSSFTPANEALRLPFVVTFRERPSDDGPDDIRPEA